MARMQMNALICTLSPSKYVLSRPSTLDSLMGMGFRLRVESSSPFSIAARVVPSTNTDTIPDKGDRLATHPTPIDMEWETETALLRLSR